jgi:hypothetical protein
MPSKTTAPARGWLQRRTLKECPFRMPPEVGQFSQDAGGCAFVKSAFGFVHNGGGGRSDACDVLQKEVSRTAITGNPDDFKKEAASFAIKPCASAGKAEVLAREARNDAIHGSSPLVSVEGGDVAPDRCCIQAAFLHASRQDAGRVSFPFNVSDGASRSAQVSEPGSQSFAKLADSGKQFDGMKIHVIAPPASTRQTGCGGQPSWHRF